MSHPSSATPIVTINTLNASPGGTRSPVGFESADEDAKRKYNRAVEKIQEETHRSSPNVLVTVQDAEASVLQSCLAARAKLGKPLAGGGFEAKFGEGIVGGDWWGWIRSVFDHVAEDKRCAIKRPSDTNVEDFADKGRIAALADWGTNLYGAPVSAASIARAGGYEMLLHLGDIYYSGTEDETKERFVDVWPTAAGKVSRALNGNHEMYSGGNAYFNKILPHFKQPSSYFAVQNRHWLLVGLDTAHTDHQLDPQQTAWLKTVVQGAGQRKLILFSHHQPYSRLDRQGPMLQSALADLFQNGRITAWYWGHEHDCIIYDRHPQLGVLGRCIGHGGIPSPRKLIIMSAENVKKIHDVEWKRLEANENAPSCLVLDGPNPLVPTEEQKFGPHGYLTLEFDGPHLIERIHLPDGREIFAGQVS